MLTSPFSGGRDIRELLRGESKTVPNTDQIKEEGSPKDPATAPKNARYY